MRAADEFQYTVLRLVPSLERGESINVGVVVFCRRLGFLEARAEIDEHRLAALWPDIDPGELRVPLRSLCDVAAGSPGAGALASLTQSERFGWIAARSSTIIQPAPVHTGLTDDPAATLDRLFAALVATPPR